MGNKMIGNLKIGDKVKYNFFGVPKGEGEIVCIIPSGEKPTEKQIEKYYEITQENKIYKEVKRAIKSERIVIKINTGGYIVVPNTESLVNGKISK